MKRADIIRDMVMRDLPKVRELLRQLGYDLDEGELVQRFKSVESDTAHALLVASTGDEVVGFLHLFSRPALEKPLEAVVQALVVDEQARGHGVGGALVAAAEQRAADKGLHSVALACETERENAQAFYARLGYQRIATSHLLRKAL